MDLKSAIAEVKAAVKNRDYKKAHLISKNILRQDKNNYFGLFFFAVSVQHVGHHAEHAEKAFQKAIEINPTHPWAWKGLISYFEKLDTEKSKIELIHLYEGILKLESNLENLTEYAGKLAAIFQYGKTEEICECLIETAKKFNNSKEEQQKILNLAIVLLEKLPESEKPFNLYDTCMEMMLFMKSSIPENFYLTYLALLSKNGEILQALKHAQTMLELFPSSFLALGWICKIYNEMFIEENPDLMNVNLDLDGLLEKVHKFYEIDPQNAIMARFTESLINYQQNKHFIAKEMLQEVTQQRSGLVYAWVLLTDILLNLNSMPEAEISLNKSQKLFKFLSNPQRIAKKILKQEIEILSHSTKEEDCRKCLKIIEENNFQSTPAKIRLLINLNKFSEAAAEIEALKSTNQREAELCQIFLLRKEKNLEKAEEFIQKNKSNNNNNAEWWFEVGLLYQELGQHKKSLEPFLKAAKFNTNNYLYFLYLGYFYNESGQFDKARRCFEKSFKLNPTSSEAGCELSKIYRKQKNWETNLALLINLTQNLPNSSNIWAWLQLGLTFLEQGNFSGAIDNLRIVIRIESDNIHCWESLADAYFSKGSFTSALKCYEKSLELSGNSLYSALQVACIKKILGDFEEAQKDFEEILRENPQHLPTLKGLAENYFNLAKQCLQQQRLGTARDFLQQGINKITLALLKRSELSCMWKLLADSLNFVAKLPQKYAFVNLPTIFVKSSSSFKNDVEKSALTIDLVESKCEILALALKFYCKAVNLSKENSYLWHDVGNSYLENAQHEKNATKKLEMFEYALSATQHATELNPHYWKHWNLLGTISMMKPFPNYSFAQHCFIKATIAETNSAIAWTNLGVLYLLLDDLKLANRAFGEGQRSDPFYVNCWLGQALIAEKMQHSDALGLFRHAVQLFQHQEGSSGYCNQVCKMLLIKQTCNIKEYEYNIKNMHAIPVALDNALWYTEKDPEDACVWNMLGIFAERMNLLEISLDAFKKSYKLCMEQQNDDTTNNKKDFIRINLARLFYRTGAVQEALKTFLQIEKCDFNSEIGLALTLFKNQQFKESYTKYQEALNLLTNNNPTEQSELLLALALIAYQFQGAEVAKILLFQSINLSAPSPWSLYALFSLSLLENDFNLAELVKKEFVKLENTPKNIQGKFSEFIYHYANLLSLLYQKKGEKNEGIKSLSILIHKYPEIGSIRVILSQFILRLETDKNRLQAGAKLVKIALKLPYLHFAPAEALHLASLLFLKAGDLLQATLFAQKVVHYSPNNSNAWQIIRNQIKRAIIS